MNRKNPITVEEKANSSTSVCGFLQDQMPKYYGGERGFPKRCVCGSEVSILTSTSKPNPGCPYFRCTRSRQDGHLFKWVEEGMYEEVKDLILNAEKKESENGMIVMNELKMEIQSLKEDVFECKTELKKLKVKYMVLVAGFCVLTLVFICRAYFLYLSDNMVHIHHA